MGAQRFLRGFTLYINDNINLALEIEELQLAELEEQKDPFQPGGSDMEIDITGLGVKAFTLKAKLKSHTPEVIGLFGGPPGIRHNITGKKLVISEEDGQEHEHAVDMKSRMIKLGSEAMKGGKATGYDMEFGSTWTYTEYWDGRPMHRFAFKRGGWDIWNFQQINAGRRSILFGR